MFIYKKRVEIKRMSMHYNRGQAIKYVKKAFNSIKPDDEIELESETLLFASIANSLIYVGDMLAELNKRTDILIEEDGDDLDGGREQIRGRAA